MLMKPKSDSYQGVKSPEELTSCESPARENYRPGMELLNHCKERDMRIPQTEEEPKRKYKFGE